jgi:hypothetical protein
LSDIADKYGAQDFGRIPEQYRDSHKGRVSFDKDVLEALGIQVEENELSELYELLSDSFKQWFSSSKQKKNESQIFVPNP